jgi:hypothetical protein
MSDYILSRDQLIHLGTIPIFDEHHEIELCCAAPRCIFFDDPRPTSGGLIKKTLELVDACRRATLMDVEISKCCVGGGL